MSTITAPSDQRVRDRIRDDLDTTLVIEAAAGTGKTTALVNRIISVIGAGRGSLKQIVAVTFTEKAAGELKLRLRGEIERARQDPQRTKTERERFTAALEQLEEARIGTIHAFCADLLRERPVEARVDPMFQVAAEDDAQAMFDSAFERWFQAVLQEPGPGMRRLLRRRDLSDRTGPREIARRAAYELLNWRDFDAPWAHFPIEREREIDALIDDIEQLGKLSESAEPDDWLGKSLATLWRPVREATRLEAVRGRDHDKLEAVLRTLGSGRHWNWRGMGGGFGALTRDEIFARRNAIRERLVAFREAAGANLAPLLREEMWPIIGYYEELKRRAGKVDFLDLLLIARNLVRDSAAVRRELQERFTHIFVDEFQDTDPLQAEILILLAAADASEDNWILARPAPGKLFVVGDPKQSIYRFRRADVSLYQAIKQNLLRNGAALEHLTVSFRGTPAIQKMVNAAFAPLMASESRSQPAYVALQPYRADLASQPAIVALPVPKPYGDYGRVTDWRIEESLPKAIAAFAKWLIVESGWTVTEREAPDVRVPVRPHHICVLFRRMNSFGRDVTRPYLRELEARHLPHVLVKGGSFNRREEVEAIRNLLGALERPDDELLVFASLRGPIIALSDSALFEFREKVGGLHPFRPRPATLPEHLAEVARALDLLRELHRGRNRRPIAETIALVLERTRAHAGIAIWPTGEQALANVMRIMDQARRYEARSGATSFRGFVDQLEERAERDEASEVPLVEEGTEGIRIMTVHRAKGLEFPVVILADLTCNETRADASRYIEPGNRLAAMQLAGCAPAELREHADDEHRRDEEEAVRLLYVATTRVRDLIVVPVVGDGPQDGWLARLNPVIYPQETERRAPLTRQPPGCPEFGDDSVLERLPKAPGKTKSVAPGLHRPQQGGHQVGWWDPSRLVIEVEEAMGLRQNKLLQADEKHEISTRGVEANREWQEKRAAALAAGAAPSLKVATATELALTATASGLAHAGEIRVAQVKRNTGRPGGKRFGTLVHATMTRVAFDADRPAIANAAASEGRIMDASPAEVEAAAEAVSRAIASPLIAEAKAAARVMREFPILTGLDDGTTVEGIADLVFSARDGSGERWMIVDFKTDFDLTPRLEEYRAQIGLYLKGIRDVTGRPAEGVILWI
jgi:ATP-dependent helicase/nuclease subunit A